MRGRTARENVADVVVGDPVRPAGRVQWGLPPPTRSRASHISGNSGAYLDILLGVSGVHPALGVATRPRGWCFLIEGMAGQSEGGRGVASQCPSRRPPEMHSVPARGGWVRSGGCFRTPQAARARGTLRSSQRPAILWRYRASVLFLLPGSFFLCSAFQKEML